MNIYRVILCLAMIAVFIVEAILCYKSYSRHDYDYTLTSVYLIAVAVVFQVILSAIYMYLYKSWKCRWPVVLNLLLQTVIFFMAELGCFYVKGV